MNIYIFNVYLSSVVLYSLNLITCLAKQLKFQHVYNMHYVYIFSSKNTSLDVYFPVIIETNIL